MDFVLSSKPHAQRDETSHAGSVTTYVLVGAKVKILAQSGDKLEKIRRIFSTPLGKVIAVRIIQDHDVDLPVREELQENAGWYHKPLGPAAERENNALVGAVDIRIVKQGHVGRDRFAYIAGGRFFRQQL